MLTRRIHCVGTATRWDLYPGETPTWSTQGKGESSGATESKARFPPTIYGPLEKGRAHLKFQHPDVQTSVRTPNPEPYGAGAPVPPDILVLLNHDSTRQGGNARNRFGGSISPLARLLGVHARVLPDLLWINSPSGHYKSHASVFSSNSVVRTPARSDTPPNASCILTTLI